jgi:16S rRNA (uracil1498-N3)-methyltransferase
MPTIHHFIQNIQEDNGRVSKKNAHHIQDVLRLSLGNIVIFSDGEGTQWKTIISQESPLIVDILESSKIEKFVPTITLIVSIIKPKLLELVIEKATELGVDRLIITHTDYSQIPLSTLDRKLSRFESIIEAAMKQSERTNRLELELLPFRELLKPLSELNIVATTQHTLNPPSILSLQNTKLKSVSLLIGPEGGFSPEEYQIIQQTFSPISLGHNILRTETSVIIGSGILSQWKYLVPIKT